MNQNLASIINRDPWLKQFIELLKQAGLSGTIRIKREANT
jgi:hypothetical protein